MTEECEMKICSANYKIMHFGRRQLPDFADVEKGDTYDQELANTFVDTFGTLTGSEYPRTPNARQQPVTPAGSIN